MKSHPLEPWIEHYLDEKDITEGTRALYRIVLKQYTGYLKKHRILYPKTCDVLNYRAWKRNQGYSAQWLYHQIGTLKGLYRYLSLNWERLNLPEAYAVDITAPLENERLEKSSTKPILSAQEAKQLILKTKENRTYIWQYRDYAMIYLILTTGLRSIEVRRAKKKDLSVIAGKRILYVQGKGRSSADDYVKISPGVWVAIKDYLGKRQDNNPYLFISHSRRSHVPYLSRSFFPRMLRRVLKECDLEAIDITPHALRHTAATLNLQRGGTLLETKRFMRHTDLSSTLIYAHHTSRLEDDSENKIERYILKENPFSLLKR